MFAYLGLLSILIINDFRCCHHFHKSCVIEWLKLNRKCPLCKQDFRGNGYEDDSDGINEDDGVEDEMTRERR